MEKIKKEYTHTHFAVHVKLTQDCKLYCNYIKNKNKKRSLKNKILQWSLNWSPCFPLHSCPPCHKSSLPNTEPGQVIPLLKIL